MRFFEFNQKGRLRVMNTMIDFLSKSPRGFSGSLILRSNRSTDVDACCILRLSCSEAITSETEIKGKDDKYYGVMGSFMKHNFQIFAFSLLAMIEGKYDRVYPSFLALPGGNVDFK